MDDIDIVDQEELIGDMPVEYFDGIRAMLEAGFTQDEVYALGRFVVGMSKELEWVGSAEETVLRSRKLIKAIGGDITDLEQQVDLQKRVKVIQKKQKRKGRRA